MSKRNDVICDICGMTVATIAGAIFKKELILKPYITVPFHFAKITIDEWDCPGTVLVKDKKHICLDCYNHIARELKIDGGGKDE